MESEEFMPVAGALQAMNDLAIERITSTAKVIKMAWFSLRPVSPVIDCSRMTFFSFLRPSGVISYIHEKMIASGKQITSMANVNRDTHATEVRPAAMSVN